MLGTPGEAGINTKVIFSCGLLHMDPSIFADQERLSSALHRHWMQSREPSANDNQSG